MLPAYLTCFLLLISAIDILSAHARGAHRRLPRDAFTKFSNTHNNEGENHKTLKAPKGARIKDISIGDGGEKIPVFWSDPKKNQKAEATQAFIVIHGRLRDGANYWSIMDGALKSAVKEGYLGADRKAFIIAPQFFSKKYNKGQYSKNELAFADVNAWQAGDTATHPKHTKITSMDALDAIISVFSNKTEYPSITNITLVGHGGGGQLVARYAAVGADVPDGVHLRYISGDPSSQAYFTEDRPVENNSGDPSCEFWNTWRYGYVNFNGTRTGGHKTAFEYWAQYINRDIVFLVGGDDTASNGDQYCPALMQGGSSRRDRNLAWWTYINTLARTQEPVQMFQQTFNNTPMFKNLPNWSNVTSKTNGIGPRLIIVEGAKHSAEEVLGGTEGRAALFSSGQLPMGWRPNDWNENVADCSMCDKIKDNLGSSEGSTGDSDGDRSSDGNGNETGTGSGDGTGNGTGSSNGSEGNNASNGSPSSIYVRLPIPSSLLTLLVAFTLAPLLLILHRL